jgi:hypothetical protein
MSRSVYIVLALLLIGGYGYAEWRGLELTPTHKSVAKRGVRGVHGGFWYGGYRGGK